MLTRDFAATLPERASASHASAALWLACIALLLFLPGFFTLPPMDRDEPRFAQASKQMLETGDYVAIHFQDEARNKKPVGIYWLQAGAVALGEAAGIHEARGKIWLYRMPSLLGAIGAVLLTYWAALPFVSRRNAFIAALLLASTVLLGVEARLAKTDAVVTATVVAAMGAMARAWLFRVGTWRNSLIFWLAIGIGILVKGPITPMIPAFAALVLAVSARSGRWLLALRPLAGLALCALIAAPWLILIGLKTHGGFFTEAIGGDMLGKVAGAKEAHGAPPLTYLAVFWATAWPMAPLAALAVPYAWRNRHAPKMLFLLSWLLPAWLLFELVPTKLPHYVLPLYPAIAIAIALALQEGALHLEQGWRRIAMLLAPGLAIALVLAVIVASLVFHVNLDWRFGGMALTVILVSLALFQSMMAHKIHMVLALLPLLAFGLAIAAYSTVLTTSAFQPFALSPRLAQARRAAMDGAANCATLASATTGYREPSLVFLTATDLAMTSGAGAAEFLNAAPCRLAFVDAAQEPAFLAALTTPLQVVAAARVAGINLNGGKSLDIGVWVRQDIAHE